VVSQFWEGFGQEAGWAKQQGEQPNKHEFSIKKRYFYF
jgi:hypothetical protein